MNFFGQCIQYSSFIYQLSTKRTHLTLGNNGAGSGIRTHETRKGHRLSMRSFKAYAMNLLRLLTLKYEANPLGHPG